MGVLTAVVSSVAWVCGGLGYQLNFDDEGEGDLQLEPGTEERLEVVKLIQLHPVPCPFPMNTLFLYRALADFEDA